MMQQLIDFTARIENNRESQSILSASKGKITRQCKIVLEALQRGEKLTVRDAMIKYGVGDLRRRVKDLKDFLGYDIKSEMIGSGFKQYYL